MKTKNKKEGIKTMKKNNLKLSVAISVLMFSSIFARELPNANVNSRSAERVMNGENLSPGISVLNINNIAYWIGKDGAYTTAGSPNGTMADYPIFTGGFIYSDGMLWGAKVKNDGLGGTTEKGEVRVGGSTYNHGLKAGRIITDDTGKILGADAPANNHVWRVRKDYATADLSVDAANYYAVGAGEVTAAQIAVVKNQYEFDWHNWPAAWGAPYDDVDGNDAYDPTIDIPGYPGADQTMWTIANDVPLIVSDGTDGNALGDSIGYERTAINLYGSDPIGIELQITLWGYAFGASDPLGNNIFKQAKMKYMGLPEMYYGSSQYGGTPDSAMLDSLYFTQWSDPDLGTFTDDYVGCDVDLSFGYVYNGNRLDGVFNGIFDLPVPAGGYDFLQGPPDNMDIDNDLDSTEFLGMTSFTYFGAGSAIDDPDLSEYNGSLQFFNLMEGYLPRPEYPVQVPWVDLSTGEDTKFALSGDPVAGSGWIDGVQLPPGDRRMVMASGPFQLKVGEEADVVFGIAGGMGLDNVSSVSVAKFHDLYGQYAYDQGFSLPSAPSSPAVAGVEMDGAIGIDWGSDANSVSSTEETISEGFEFEGYVVYQLPSATSPISEAVKVATYDKVNLIGNILDPAIDPITGLVVDAAKQTGTNAGVQRYFSTDYDEIRGRPMSNGITYHFAVTAYSYLADNAGSPFKTLESGETRVSLTPRSANPGEVVYSEMSSDIEVTQSGGSADASVAVKVLNPNGLKDQTYKVTFDAQDFYLDVDGKWKPVVAARIASKTSDCTGSTMSGTASPCLDVGTIDLVFNFTMNCGNNWIDGIKFTFPSDAGTINSVAVTGTDLNTTCTGGGQNCNNLNGSFDNATGVVLFGTEGAPTGYGPIEGSNQFTINYSPAGAFSQITIPFAIFDDAYDGTEVDVTGDVIIPALSYATKTEKHWNLSTGSGQVLLEDQTFISGSDLYGGNSVANMSSLTYNMAAAVTIDGFQTMVTGNYDAPTDYLREEFTPDLENAALYGDAIYDVRTYGQNGWAANALATSTLGYGVSSVDTLQRDIEVRFTGEFDDTPHDTLYYVNTAGAWSVAADAASATDTLYYYSGTVAENGGSHAWLFGANGYSLGIHPEQPEGYAANADGSFDPIRIWVPFEVWDMEAPGGPQQIDIALVDRFQGWDQVAWSARGVMVSDDDENVYSFNPYGRMYSWFINTPYQENGEYLDADGDLNWGQHATWNLTWLDNQFNQGDVIKFVYANPIQLGLDEFTFSTKASMTSSSNDVSEVSVYPNPYYGTHELESSRAEKYVSFNHLPVEATIDIYSLGGVYVRSIEKNDASQFAKWDLKNQYGYPVASGMYVARIKSGGEEKILKIALVQETQVLKYY